MKNIRPGSSLSLSQTRCIQDAFADGETEKALADIYNISADSVSRIIKKSTNKARAASLMSFDNAPPRLAILERVFKYVKTKDNPTARCIAKALGITLSQANTALSELLQQNKIIRIANVGQSTYRGTAQTLSDVREVLKLMDKARASC